jgi:hypothetical protein
MANREVTTKFFPEELMTVDLSDASAFEADKITTTWTGRGKVIWTRGWTPNELNPRLNPSTLHQPEQIDSKFDNDDKQIGWRLFVPSGLLAKGKASPPLDPIPVTLLLGRGGEELGYGLRIYFERAGTSALLCLSGREGADKGGRWNVGIGQKTIEGIFSNAGLKGKPQVQVLAGYSTGYGVVQTINNDLVPLAPVKRLVFFDCIYRSDSPPIPKGDPPPTLTIGDKPDVSATAPNKVLSEMGGAILSNPFNTRRAITRLASANKNCVFAAYSTTSGGSPRHAVWKITTKTATTKESKTLVTLGNRPIVEFPKLAELREMKTPKGSSYSPYEAFDALILSRYVDLGIKAGLVVPTEPPQVYKDIIKLGLPPRGTIFSSDAIKTLVTVPATIPQAPIDLMAWAKTLPKPPSGADREKAGKLLLAHLLLLPGWNYGTGDLTEYRHAGCLSEFGWELLPV